MSEKHFKDKLYLHDWWDIPVAYHPTNTGKIIINIPGAGGSIDGYMNKYLNLGTYIQSKDIASFVRIPNDRPQEFILTARTVVNYCLDNSQKICGSESPEIWLMGLSAGGASILLTAWEYPEVTKVLAINPYINLPKTKELLKKVLPEYKGELFMAIGEDDSVIDPETINFINKYRTNTREFRVNLIPNCDHQLTGEDNSRILSQLPEYFFLKKYIKNAQINAKNGVLLLKT